MITTQTEFKRYLCDQGCKVVINEEWQTRVIRFINPNKDTEAFLFYDKHDRIEWENIVRICSRLGVPMPTNK